MKRRALLVIGVLLLAFGVLAATGIVTRESAELVVDVGVGRAEASFEDRYPLWVSVGAIAAGIAVVGWALKGTSER